MECVLVWTITLSVYAFAFPGRLWETEKHEAAPVRGLAPDLPLLATPAWAENFRGRKVSEVLNELRARRD